MVKDTSDPIDADSEKADKIRSDNKKCAADEVSVAHAYSINNNNECVEELPPLKRRGDELFSLQSRANSGGQNYCCKKIKKAFGKCHCE